MSGLVEGALVAEGLKLLISEAKKFKDFKPLSKDLASSLERLIPLAEEIDSIQQKLDVSFGGLKELNDTIQKAQIVVHECQTGVSWHNRSILTRKIAGINKDIHKFCQTDLQLLMYKDWMILFDRLSTRMDLMSVPALVLRDRCSVPKIDKVLVGLERPLKELKKRLLEDAEVNLVVSAPPGCGKTTLVTQLCNDADVKGKFKHIFFWVVSSTPNFRVIVQELLYHNGYQALPFENDSQALNGLRKLLEELKGPILLVLDDVWPGAEFMLKNFRINLPDYKILVTSRSESLSFGFNYHLKPLEDKDARDLLIQWASPPPAGYEDLLQKILKRCNGFPLLIEVVGVSLNEKSLNTWKGLVESWSEGKTIPDNPQPSVLKCLQSSFNVLKSNLKECFLDMGSFLEDQKIRASVIIDIWVELYGNVSSNTCMKDLEDLASQNLLKLIRLGDEHEDGFYNDFLVTQHDILRELAIHESKSKDNLESKRLNLDIREDRFPDWCLNQTHPINASLLSISSDDFFSSKWVELECPKVEALVLHLSSSVYELPSFIARMKKLKVLIITNHIIYPAILWNFRYLSSLQNLKRIRLEKVSITLLDILQLQLGSLKKLSLFMCSFGEVFYEAEEVDFSKALPSLEEVDIDYCYDLEELPYWVSQAVSLKKLSLTNCNKLSLLPEAIGDLSKLEVLRLNSCFNLSELPETTERLSNLRFLNISDCLGLKKLPIGIGKLDKLKKISMRKCWKCELPESVSNLKNLEVECDKETRKTLWKRLKPKMINLTVTVKETEHNLNLYLT